MKWTIGKTTKMAIIVLIAIILSLFACYGLGLFKVEAEAPVEEHRGYLKIRDAWFEKNPAVGGETNILFVNLHSQWELPPDCDTELRVTVNGEPVYEELFDTSVAISQTMAIPFFTPNNPGYNCILITTRRTDNNLGDTVPRYVYVTVSTPTSTTTISPTVTPTKRPTRTPTATPTTTVPHIYWVTLNPILALPGQEITVRIRTSNPNSQYEVGIEYFDGWQIQDLTGDNTFRFNACRNCAPKIQKIWVRIFKKGDYVVCFHQIEVFYTLDWPIVYLPIVLQTQEGR